MQNLVPLYMSCAPDQGFLTLSSTSSVIDARVEGRTVLLHGVLELAIVSELLTHDISGWRVCLQCQLQVLLRLGRLLSLRPAQPSPKSKNLGKLLQLHLPSPLR